MMKPSLPAYFSRIGFLGHARPDEATLINLHRLHAETIPFENLDVLLGRPIQLSTEALFDKLVASGRGGYCLEQNGLFAWVLQAIGFEIAPLTARVMLGEPEALTARTHSLLAVKIRHETWLADVGLGGKTLREPVRLAPHQAQETAGGVYRIEPHSAGDYTMEIQRANGAFAPLYRFDLRPSEPADFDMANFYLSHWEGSPFRRRLLVSRQLSTGGKLTLKNRLLTRRDGADHVKTRDLNDEAMHAALTAGFGLRLDQPGPRGISPEELAAALRPLAPPPEPLAD